MLSDDAVKNATILVVDDEPPNVLLLKRILEREGYRRIHTTNDPTEVSTLYEKLQPELVLLDLLMPQMDGFAVMARLSETDRSGYLPVLVLTADQSPQTRLRALDSGAKDFLVKPFDRDEVLLRIRNMLEVRLFSKQAADERQRLSAVLNGTGDAIAMFDTDGNLQVANLAFRTLFGFDGRSEDELHGDEVRTRFEDRFQDPDVMDRLMEDLAQATEEASATVVELRAPERGMFHQSLRPVYDTERNIIGRLLVYRDVSQELEMDAMKRELLQLRSALEKEYSFANIVGSSAKMREMFALMEQAIDSDITVLIEGESGTGKEVVARALHANGDRKGKAFVPVNCAAIPETLFESELFGHEKGAFTGATTQRIGKFEQAHGGTIFLDEIGEMPLALQTKFLRVLQEREIERVGGRRSIPVDVRVIAATNRNLEDDVRANRFRQDLFYRVAAFPLTLPPLRDRRDDIPPLAEHFLTKIVKDEKKEIVGISRDALAALVDYDWDGNVRELENVIKRAIVLETTNTIQLASLPPSVRSRSNGAYAYDPASKRPFMTLDEAEKQAVIDALEATEYHVQRCAEALGINRATLYRKMARHGIEKPEET
ncbi:MAG: sigma 54-interacting transcriptional regulator [Candidatus Poribacteria bacterium]|nr:sigma 54-interacting transcriptional regulator [Candidatus Poribacteria bacterium]